MRFCCPDCGRDEEILLDRKPRCLVCRVQMIAASDYSEVWMSPYIAIVRMNTLRETYGVERARTDGRFKKEREAWATGVLAMALSKLNNEEWWIEVETFDRTPDTRLRQIEQSSGHNIIQTRSIEIVDWQENVGDIMEVIGKKCERAYPGHYILLVHARHGGKVLDLDHVIREMGKLRSPFLEVWVIGSSEPGHMKVVCVAPGGAAVDLSFELELGKASKQRSFLKRGIRGTKPGFREIGLTYLPIPRGN
jgi:hypothetical protein